jgi:hypothetical protein
VTDNTGKGCLAPCRWRIWGRNRQYEAVVEATCDSSGTPLRAPTADTGLAPFCRDSFAGKVCGRVRCMANGERKVVGILGALCTKLHVVQQVINRTACVRASRV